MGARATLLPCGLLHHPIPTPGGSIPTRMATLLSLAQDRAPGTAEWQLETTGSRCWVAGPWNHLLQFCHLQIRNLKPREAAAGPAPASRGQDEHSQLQPLPALHLDCT